MRCDDLHECTAELLDRIFVNIIHDSPSAEAFLLENQIFIEYISAVFSGLAEIENRNIRIFFIDQVVE